jgi:nitroimidazol reductase NimA-like FMN-containing flavoprotein (pyridoxamine 5'-phosphate oxidase superfamily)
MRKIISQIRDIVLIENELVNSSTGILALNLKDDKIAQLATTFLYQDKNVYFFFNDSDEEFEDIKFETDVSFTIVKNYKIKKTQKSDFNPTYNIFSISVSGLIKEVDDQKSADILRKNYLRKYSAPDKKEKTLKFNKVVFIDTEEIQAYEETGG